MNPKVRKVVRITSLLLLLAVFLFAGSNRPAQAGVTLPLKVPADVEWVSTGIWIYSDWVGSEVNIQTNGVVFTIQGCPGCQSGPGGNEYVCQDSSDGEIEYVCALAGAHYGELIGRVGEVVFPIGENTSFTLPAKGFLYLTANDYLGTYWDNAGGFTVLIKMK